MGLTKAGRLFVLLDDGTSITEEFDFYFQLLFLNPNLPGLFYDTLAALDAAGLGKVRIDYPQVFSRLQTFFTAVRSDSNA